MTQVRALQRLLVVRHAIAEDPEAGRRDADRRLTDEGRKRMRAGARALHSLVDDLTLVATSPLRRAVETAQIIAETYGDLPTTTTSHLTPGSRPLALLDWIGGQDANGTIALVGHEPDLGLWVSWALAGEGRDFLPLKQGSACLLDLPHALSPGHGVLRWALPPQVLRRLGGA